MKQDPFPNNMKDTTSNLRNRMPDLSPTNRMETFDQDRNKLLDPIPTNKKNFLKEISNTNNNFNYRDATDKNLFEGSEKAEAQEVSRDGYDSVSVEEEELTDETLVDASD